MNKKFKKRWIAALRSGKYKQGTGRLRNDVGHCCLGVACEVYGRPYDAERGTPTDEVLVAIGLGRDEALVLAGLNDAGSTEEHAVVHNLPVKRFSKPAGFRRIATYIEKYL